MHEHDTHPDPAPLVEARHLWAHDEVWWSIDVDGDGHGQAREVPGGWELEGHPGEVYPTLAAAVTALCGPLYGLTAPAPVSAFAPLRAALQRAHAAAQAATRAAQDGTGLGTPAHLAGQAAGLAHALRLLDVHEQAR